MTLWHFIFYFSAKMSLPILFLAILYLILALECSLQEEQQTTFKNKKSNCHESCSC